MRVLIAIFFHKLRPMVEEYCAADARAMVEIERLHNMLPGKKKALRSMPDEVDERVVKKLATMRMEDSTRDVLEKSICWNTTPTGYLCPPLLEGLMIVAENPADFLEKVKDCRHTLSGLDGEGVQRFFWRMQDSTARLNAITEALKGIESWE